MKSSGQWGKALRVAAAVGLAVGISGGAAAQNLIVNGGFETGDFTGWTQGGNTGFTFVGCPGFFVPPEGACEAYLGPIGSDGTLAQTVNGVANRGTYISFILDSDGFTPNDFSVSYAGIPLLSLSDVPATAGTPYSFYVYPSVGGPQDLVFSFRNDPGYLTLDAVSLSIPEPATLGLMGIALAGLGFGRRKKTA